jgi:hypothetical protein
LYICQGACFRDLPCVRVRDNIVELNPDVKREYLDSGKPLVIIFWLVTWIVKNINFIRIELFMLIIKPFIFMKCLAIKFLHYKLSIFLQYDALINTTGSELCDFFCGWNFTIVSFKQEIILICYSKVVAE